MNQWSVGRHIPTSTATDILSKYQQIFAISQSLPGSASIKMIFTINVVHGGFVAGFIAFLLFRYLHLQLYGSYDLYLRLFSNVQVQFTWCSWNVRLGRGCLSSWQHTSDARVCLVVRSQCCYSWYHRLSSGSPRRKSHNG